MLDRSSWCSSWREWCIGCKPHRDANNSGHFLPGTNCTVCLQIRDHCAHADQTPCKPDTTVIMVTKLVAPLSLQRWAPLSPQKFKLSESSAWEACWQRAWRALDSARHAECCSMRRVLREAASFALRLRIGSNTLQCVQQLQQWPARACRICCSVNFGISFMMHFIGSLDRNLAFS
jgi:hypothetical protein